MSIICFSEWVFIFPEKKKGSWNSKHLNCCSTKFQKRSSKRWSEFASSPVWTRQDFDATGKFTILQNCLNAFDCSLTSLDNVLPQFFTRKKTLYHSLSLHLIFHILSLLVPPKRFWKSVISLDLEEMWKIVKFLLG